ncbi:MAG: hypothetical protein AABX52_03075 [Nanoarchaeota archaeon]
MVHLFLNLTFLSKKSIQGTAWGQTNTILPFSLQDNSLKNQIIDLLSVKWPLSVTDVHSYISKQVYRRFSYQAVRKAVKQLISDRCLTFVEKNKVQINPEWLFQVKCKIQHIEDNYSGRPNFPKTFAQTKTGGFNVLVAKDGIVRDKLREEMLNQFFKELIPIYKKELGPHNIFQRDELFILDYFQGLQKKHELLFFLLDGKVVGGTVFEKKDESIQDGHSIWKLKHFALKSEVGRLFEQTAIKEVEDRLLQRNKSIKIQLHFSEHEKRYISLFESVGFNREGTLKDHYRVGEEMYIYTKHYPG